VSRLGAHVAAWTVSLTLFSPVVGATQQGFELEAGPDLDVLPPATFVDLQGSLRGPKRLDVPNTRFLSWEQISGAPVKIVGTDTLTPRVTPSRAGRVRLVLRFEDPLAGPLSDEVALHFWGADQDAEVAGEARKWHKLALTFAHDAVLSETGPINPFLDLRLVLSLFHPESGTRVSVPGFFAADGNAAESGASAGTKWRVNFTPDQTGLWFYAASFRAGRQIALHAGPEFGRPLSFDGANGTFTVAPADPAAPGLLAKGRLEYVGSHHLRFAETHERFLKSGAGSPENWLAYYEFDATVDQGGTPNDLNTGGHFDGLHHFDPHLGDYADLGVPTWRGQEGRRLFGAINYLASRGVNSFYTLTYNLDGGDGQEVGPWVPSGDKQRFDVSKLAQWERAVDHLTRAGLAWHVVTQETENDHVLDGGRLGTERKLYYRELVARFAHAPGLVWNLGEENTNTTEARMAFADYLRATDPYDHPITIHNVVGDLFGTLNPLLGTHLELVSIQGDPVLTPPRAQQLVQSSAAAGRPWVVNFDEQTPGSHGVVPDAFDFWHDLIRRDSLWPMLLGQGGGCAWYFGGGFPHSDLDCEDFRSRENMWTLAERATRFVREHVPFAEMFSDDALASGASEAQVLALPGEFYLVYLPLGGPVTLDLGASTEPMRVSWFDARNGGPLFDGPVPLVSGPGPIALGSAPGTGDWCAFVRRAANLPPQLLEVRTEPARLAAGQDFAVLVHARDPNGPSDPLTGTVAVRDPNDALVTTLPLTHRGGTLYSFFLPSAPAGLAGEWRLEVELRDAGGLEATGSTSFELE
jgi:hypothetical protein